MIQLSRKLILASGSPRRQFLMREAGFRFEVRKPDVDEQYPETMPSREVAQFLAKKKAERFQPGADEIIMTADTIVILEDRILNKPLNSRDAMQMLGQLSGNLHHVVTGVCLLSKEKQISFDDTTEVTFKELHDDEIRFYVETYRPFDKAGAYGAQDWIGMIAIERIVGSYFNVMGLPMHKVYSNLAQWSHSAV